MHDQGLACSIKPPTIVLADQKATERLVSNTAITKERVIQMLLEDRELARAALQVSAAIRATELLGKEIRMFIDRREEGRPGEFDHLSDEELDEAIVQQLVEHGMPERDAREFVARQNAPASQETH